MSRLPRRKDEYSHIRYDWQDEQEIPCSLTLHQLDNKLAFYGIPLDASRAPLRYDYEHDQWIEVRK